MKNITEMAKQAGLFTHKEVQPEITHFAKLVRNAALEEAIQACKLALDAHAIRNLKETTERKPVFTTGHCKEKAKAGGCQLHNLQCGYPECDRRLT